MKGVVLVGVLGTWLNPLAKGTLKHLLPVYDQPVIYGRIQTLEWKLRPGTDTNVSR